MALGVWVGVKVGAEVGTPVVAGMAADLLGSKVALMFGVGAASGNGVGDTLVEHASVNSISKGIENKYGWMPFTLAKSFIFSMTAI